MFSMSSRLPPPSYPKTNYCIKSESCNSEPIFEASKKLYDSKKHQELTRLYANCDYNARKRSIENFWAYVSQYSKKLNTLDKQNFKNLLLYINDHIPLYDDILIYAMNYWDKLNFSYDSIIRQQPYSWLNLLIATLCLADKYIGNEEPHYPTTFFWANISNLSSDTLSKFEITIWLNLKCSLNISPSKYKLYRTYLTQ